MMKKWTTESILNLINTKGINSTQIIQFVDKYDSYDDFIVNEKQIISKLEQKGFFSNGMIDIRVNVDEQLELCRTLGIKIIKFWDDDYPNLLKEIPSPPIILFVKGEFEQSDFDSISIVGTRHCTSYGKLAVEKFVYEFVNRGITITSGLASGIDTHAHLSAVKFGGRTLAVIASGIDRIMPAYSLKNAERIVDSGGAIISEYACSVSALPAFFPQRNRIISGLSRATLVIESAEKGGSLITAKFAFDQGRDVFALPGNIFADKCKGTNNLIARNIAAPAISPEFILNELGLNNETQLDFRDKVNLNLSSQEVELLDKIDHEPRHIDELAITTSMEIPALLVKLLELEFKGLIRQLPGQHYVKI